MQDLIIHADAKPIRTTTEVISVTALFDSIHVVTLLADDVPQLSHRVADNINKAFFIEFAWYLDWISRWNRHGGAS